MKNLYRLLTKVRLALQDMVQEGTDRPTEITSTYGTHEITYGTDDNGDEYATVGFKLPFGVYAELDDGPSDPTYGSLAGFRLYYRAHAHKENVT